MARRRARRKVPERVGVDALPVEFRKKMEKLLGGESEAFFSALEREETGLRVNTLRAAPEDAQRLLPFEVEPLPFPEEGFLVSSGERPGKHPLHHAGLYYLQDPAAMAVGAVLAPQPGERVADLSAAPGGKSTHLAALMEDTGFLLANDIHPARARELAGNLERCGVRNAVVTVESIERLADHFGAWFDRVLLDAPCSGEAMFCASEAARSGWSEAAVQGCARRQEDLLIHAAKLVRPGGLLAYSTCTFSPEEDEQVIAHFLTRNDEFRLEEPPAIPGAEPGRPEWAGSGSPMPELERTIRLWPHRYPGAGHFIALFRRTDGAESRLEPSAEPALSNVEREQFRALQNDIFGSEVISGGLTARGAELFAVPAAAPDLAGLRTFRPGWWVGTLRTGRVEPAHALAMAARADTPVRSLDLHLEEDRVAAFIRGETMQSEGEAGWLLVTVHGFPIGWGKRVGSTVKNHLPKGLRAM